MTKLDDLIAELCPDGVEYRKLGEICTIVRGASPRPISSYITNDDTGVNWIKIGDSKIGSKFIESTVEKITEDGANKSRRVKPGDFILSNSMSFGRPYILKINGCIHDGWISLSNYEKSVLSDYLYYILVTSDVQHQMKRQANFGGAIQNLNIDIVKGITIPVPPLKVQEEIVRILDTFSKLQTELQTELQSRKKQYKYYLDSFFGESYEEMLKLAKKGMFEIEELGNLGTLIRGKRFVRDDIVESGVPCIHYGDLYTYYGVYSTKAKTYLNEEQASHLRFASKGDVVIVGAGENNEDIGVGVAWLGDEDVVVHDACYIFKHKMNPKYVSYFLRSSSYHTQIKKYVSEGKICAISARGIGKSIMPVPPLSEQKRIVSILDRFDALCNDLTQGLPAEIEARRKQYEYYRDRLLTFSQKGALA